MSIVILGAVIFAIWYSISAIFYKADSVKKKNREKEKRQDLKSHDIFFTEEYYPVLKLTKSEIKSSKFRENYEFEDQPLKGASEYILFREMGKYFNSSTISHGKFQFNPYGRQSKYEPYYPDIVYYDKKEKILIDIEIDEPYVKNSKKPIHYVRESSLDSSQKIGVDDNRNKKFIENGWIVIRFSEKQVLLQAKSCCLYILRVINFLKVNDPFSDIDLKNKSLENSEITAEKRWTKKNALSAKR